MNKFYFAFILIASLIFWQSCKKDKDKRPNCERNKFGKVVFKHFDPACIGLVYYVVDKEVYKKGFCNDFANTLDSVNVGQRIVEVQNSSRRIIFSDTVEVRLCNSILVEW